MVNILRVTVNCFLFDIIVFAMLPAHGIWWETVSSLDVMWPLTTQRSTSSFSSDSSIPSTPVPWATSSLHRPFCGWSRILPDPREASDEDQDGPVHRSSRPVSRESESTGNRAPNLSGWETSCYFLQKMNRRDHRHSNMGSSFHCLLVDSLQCSSFQVAGYDTV